MDRSRLIPALLALTLLAPVCLFAGRATAIQPSEDSRIFGPVGITPGERAIVNIHTIGPAEEEGAVSGTPWTFQLRVFDSRGHLVQDQRLRLAPGVIRSVAIAIPESVEAPSTAVRRRTFRAEIVAFNPQPDPPARWAATLEVIDRLTERTSILLGGPDTMPPVMSAGR